MSSLCAMENCYGKQTRVMIYMQYFLWVCVIIDPNLLNPLKSIISTYYNISTKWVVDKTHFILILPQMLPEYMSTSLISTFCNIKLLSVPVPHFWRDIMWVDHFKTQSAVDQRFSMLTIVLNNDNRLEADGTTDWVLKSLLKINSYVLLLFTWICKQIFVVNAE